MTIYLAQAFPHPKTNPTSVAFYDIWVGNGAGLFFQQLLARAHTGHQLLIVTYLYTTFRSPSANFVRQVVTMANKT